MGSAGMPLSLSLFDDGMITTSAAEDTHDEFFLPTGFNPENIYDPITFFIKGNEHYIDLDHSYFEIQATVEGNNGEQATNASYAKFSGDSNVALINNVFHSLFSALTVQVNDSVVSFTSDNYQYVTYFQNLLNYTNEFERCNGAVYGWQKDIPKADDSKGETLDSPSNAGAVERKKWVTSSTGETLNGIIRLRSPFFMNHRYVLSFLDLKITLQRTKNQDFLFMYLTEKATSQYRIKINNIYFYAQRPKILPLMVEAIERRMFKDQQPIIYNLTDFKLITKTYPTFGMEIIEDNLFHGEVPSRIIIGMVDSAAYGGIKTANPFRFQSFNLTRIGLFVNGAPFPFNPVEMSFPDKASRMYHLLLSSLSSNDGGAGSLNITLNEFKHGFTVFGYDMSPDQYGSETSSSFTNKSANVRLQLNFKTASTASMSLLIYYEVRSRMQVDSLRQVRMYNT